MEKVGGRQIQHKAKQSAIFHLKPTIYVTGFTKIVLNSTFGNSRNTKLRY